MATIDTFLNALPTHSAASKVQITYEFAQMLEQLARVLSSRLVLFLDEFSEVCRVIERNELLADRNPGRRVTLHPNEMLVDVDLMQTFSSLLKSQTLRHKVMLCFAVRPFMAAYDKSRNLQILKLTKPITLYYLDKDAANALIEEPLRGTLSYEAAAVDYLRKETAGHPYLIQFILKEVVDAKIASGGSTIGVEDIQVVEERMVSEGPAYDAVFDVLDSDHSVEEVMGRPQGLLGKGALSLIARGGEDGRRFWVSAATVLRQMEELKCDRELATDVLAQLVRAKILSERDGEGDLEFRMAVPLLRKRYVRQNMHLKHFRRRT